MSNTFKDKPYEMGGQRHKYYITERWHAWFTRDCRRKARAQAKNDLRHDREPQPVYPIESAYYD